MDKPTGERISSVSIDYDYPRTTEEFEDLRRRNVTVEAIRIQQMTDPLSSLTASRERSDSAGSCMAIRGELARKVNFPDDDVFVGLSRQIHEQGCSLWFDPTLAVAHL